MQESGIVSQCRIVGYALDSRLAEGEESACSEGQIFTMAESARLRWQLSLCDTNDETEMLSYAGWAHVIDVAVKARVTQGQQSKASCVLKIMLRTYNFDVMFVP